MHTFQIGDRVVDHILDEEGTVVATDGDTGEFAKIKVKYDGFFGVTKWEFASMVRPIITN